MNKSILIRLKKEIDYFKMKEWSFQDVGNFWDEILDYDEINKQADSYFRRFTDSYRLSNIPEKSYILDICSRTGNGSLFFWRKGKARKIVCADFSKEMQKACKKRLTEEGVRFEQRLIGSLPLPFENNEFEAILCFETIEHLSSPDEFIKELARLIKPGGELILTTPNVLWEPIHSLAAILDIHHSEGPHRFIPYNKLNKYIFEAGFEIVSEKSSVLIPGGPKLLVKFGEWLEQKIGKRLLSTLALRRIFICKKIYK